MSSQQVIYCIPGLGIDHRIFQKIDLSNYDVRYLDYDDNFSKKDTVSSFAAKFAEQIDPTTNPILIGMSLGGILSVEISRLIPCKAIVLISSVKNKEEIPNLLKLIPKITVTTKTTTKLAIETSIVLKPYYDSSDKEGTDLFESMIKNANINFINWGFKAVSKWNFNQSIKCPYFHIHGTNDLIFPLKNIDNANTIKGGTHYMLSLIHI